MAVSINKAVNEIIQKIKSVKLPERKAATLWDILLEQISQEGKWDEDLINSIKVEISKWLGKLNGDELLDLYDQTESPYDSSLEADKNLMMENLSEEILNRVLDRVDDSFEYSDSFTEESVYNDIIDSDEEDLMDFEEDEDFDDDEFFYDEDEEKY